MLTCLLLRSVMRNNTFDAAYSGSNSSVNRSTCNDQSTNAMFHASSFTMSSHTIKCLCEEIHTQGMVDGTQCSTSSFTNECSHAIKCFGEVIHTHGSVDRTQCSTSSFANEFSRTIECLWEVIHTKNDKADGTLSLGLYICNEFSHDQVVLNPRHASSSSSSC